MTAIAQSWTDSVVVIAPTKMSQGTGYCRATLDLRSKKGARLFLKLGRLQTTAIGTAIDIYVRPMLNAGSPTTNVPATHPTAAYFQSQIAVTVCPTVATTANPGDKTLVLSSGTSMAKGDTICITDSGGTTFTRLEFKTVSKVATATLTLAEPLEYQHTSGQADIVSRLADVFAPLMLAGGSLYEIIFDYQVASSGGDVVVMAHAQTYDNDVVS